LSVIRDHDDQGAFVLPRALEMFDETTDLLVDERQFEVVDGFASRAVRRG